MNNTKENLLERHIITSNNLKDMIDAYNYGTATPMQWLIGTLKQLRMILLEDQQVTLYDKSGNSKILSKSDFNNFVLEYFDQFILDESSKLN